MPGRGLGEGAEGEDVPEACRADGLGQVGQQARRNVRNEQQHQHDAAPATTG